MLRVVLCEIFAVCPRFFVLFQWFAPLSRGVRPVFSRIWTQMLQDIRVNIGYYSYFVKGRFSTQSTLSARRFCRK